jgi:signal transduction histidine kinase
LAQTLKQRLGADEILRLIALIISIFLFPQQPNQVAFIFFFFFLLAISFVRIWQNNLKENHLLLLLEILIAGLALFVTGYLNSPFLIYLLIAFVTAAGSFPNVFFLISFFIIFLIINLALLLSRKSPNYWLLTNTFLIFFFLLAWLTRKRKAETDFGQNVLSTEKQLFENFQKSLRSFKNAVTFSELYKEMVKFYVNFGINDFLVYFPNLESFYRIVFSDTLDIENLTDKLDFEPRHPPDVISFNDKEYSALTKLPEILIYLPETELDDLSQGLLKLGTDFAAYRAAEIYLSESEKQLLERFSALYDASQQLSNETDLKRSLEVAASSVKRMTGMQKAVVCLCSSPEKIGTAFNDQERTVIKGRLNEHPEKIWIQGFLKAATEAIQNKKPVVASFSKFGITLLCLPISYGERVFGVIAGITSLEKAEAIRDLRTMEIISTILGLYLINSELIQKREAAAVLQERDRIAREMHDNLIQSLFSLMLLTETYASEIRNHPNRADELLADLKQKIQSIIKETREMIVRLYPSSLATDGFEHTLKRVLSSFEGIDFALDLQPLPETISLTLQNAIIRIIQEAVINAVKHGKASMISISVKTQNSSINLVIKDNGTGFDVSKLEYFLKSKEHFGLSSIISRVQSFGGSYELQSQPGEGTEWKFSFPLNAGHEE